MSNVSSIGREEPTLETLDFTIRANARNVWLYYPYRQYTNLFIFLLGLPVVAESRFRLRFVLLFLFFVNVVNLIGQE